MDWNSRFHYGMYKGWRVAAVYSERPSYLAWTVGYTDNTFTEEILERLEQLSFARHRGFTYAIRKRFDEARNQEGVPW